MTKFRNQSTGEVKTESQIRAENPNASFPKPLKAVHLDGYDAVLPSPKPTETDLQRAQYSGVEQDANGNWVEAWTLVDKSLEELKREYTQTVNSRHQSTFYSNIPYQDKWIQFRSDHDYIRLSGILMSIDSFGATEVEVIMEDNTVETMPAATYKATVGPALSRNSQTSIHARKLKNQIKAAKKIADLPDITQGWPV